MSYFWAGIIFGGTVLATAWLAGFFDGDDDDDDDGDTGLPLTITG